MLPQEHQIVKTPISADAGAADQAGLGEISDAVDAAVVGLDLGEGA